MTPERQKWWDSLPQREKELREALKAHRLTLKINKDMLTNKNSTKEGYVLKLVHRQKILIRALKHELDKETAMVYTGQNEGVLPIYRCKKCGGTTIDFEYYCPWCGRKVKEWGK